MNISVIGTNGMLSVCLTRELFNLGHQVHTFGLDKPIDYPCSDFSKIDLVKGDLDYKLILNSDLIIYAAGAGVQAALATDSSIIYSLNLSVPIDITLKLKEYRFKGIFMSFGTYMEIGQNDILNKEFTENEIVGSSLPVSDDYALSKRLFSHYLKDFKADFKYWHFILPNMFSYDDIKPGTRLIPYVLRYLNDYKKGLNPQIPKFSEGLQIRQFILMEDIINVIIKSVEMRIPSGIYNIGGGEILSIRKLIERLFNLYHVPINDNMFGKELRRDGDVKCLKMDGTKLYNKINYLPNNSLEDVFELKN